ncbi:MAG: hypothetical protein RL722_660, partial [Pseudomonadota bacterium]
IHGDLHTGNLLIQGSSRSDPTRLHHAQVCFIDLDSLAQGHACVDLALLASRLILQALLGQASAGEVGEAIRKWPYEYAKSSGDETVTRTYPWMVSALLLARQIKTGIRHLAPDMAQISSSLIDLSMAISMRRTMDWNFDECLQRSCEQLKQHRHEDKEAGAARQFNLLTMEASS